LKPHRFKITFNAAAFTVVAATFSAAAMRTASAEACAGPFRQCAISVNAQCSRDADGVQRIRYWDGSGRVIQFEQCAGRIYEARGLPNPYKTGIASSALPLPRTELLYPLVDP
jgi:short subunit dehydrogenase-like uncharacterized protein